MMVSVQTGGMIPFWGAKDGYRMIREAGFDGIDWGLDESWTRSEIQRGILSPCVFTQPLDKVYEFYREELEQIEENGLRIVQAHAPFPPYVKDFPALNGYAVEVYRQCIRFATVSVSPSSWSMGSPWPWTTAPRPKPRWTR